MFLTHPQVLSAYEGRGLIETRRDRQRPLYSKQSLRTPGPTLRPRMYRRMFNAVVLVSIALAVVAGMLWARSSTHREQVRLHAVRWYADDDMRNDTLVVHWHSGTVQTVLGRLRLEPNYFAEQGGDVVQQTKRLYPPGTRYDFAGDSITRFFCIPPHGWKAHYWQRDGHRQWTLVAPLWLPTALFAVPPVAWLVHRQRRRHQAWQFSLRTLALVTTATCLTLASVIWLRA